jgi:hypothetical protein
MFATTGTMGDVMTDGKGDAAKAVAVGVDSAMVRIGIEEALE